MKIPMLFICGCAALLTEVGCFSVESYRQDYCNYNGAFGMGINDGKSGSDFRIHVAQYCEKSDRDSVEQAYRDGYEIGLRKAPTRVNVNNMGNLNCDESNTECSK